MPFSRYNVITERVHSCILGIASRKADNKSLTVLK